MSAAVVELRAGSGGEDARMLVRDQLGVYCRYASRRGL